MMARPDVTHQYAQTNLQLFNQMLAGGYSDADLELMRRCYDLAIQLFSGLYRPTGKPFLSHLVGTASILAAMETPAPVVGAGLLHAAYTHGDFGIQFPSHRRREQVRRGASREVEDVVARYGKLTWTDASMRAIRRDLRPVTESPGQAPEQRSVILIRLANELEDSLDLGLLYCLKGDERQPANGLYADTIVELARDLGFAEVAHSLAQALQENRVGPPPPPALRTAATSSYTAMSTSYRMRPTVRIGRSLFAYLRPMLDRLAAIRTARAQ
ncbi:MAG: DUF6817 domain-containing protein [Chloroflexota bacterium]